MKDNLEDLLKQVYAQKEEPSQEFCRSVIRKVEEEDRRGLLEERGNRRRVCLAAVCVVVMILVGIGMRFSSQGHFPVQESYRKQEIAKRGNSALDMTENPSNQINKVETKNRDSSAKPEIIEQQNEGDQAEGRKADSTTESENWKADSAKGSGNQKSSSDSGGGNQKSSSDSGSGNQKLSSDSGNGDQKSGSDRGSGSRNPGSDAENGNQNPQIMQTAKPAETSQPRPSFEPSLPEKTMQPQIIPDLQGNYIAVCSIETLTFSAIPPSSTEEEVCYPDGLFSSRLILSYVQLQTLIGDIEKQLTDLPDDGLQKILLQLQRYDPSYFVSNALCFHLSQMETGLDIGLQSVRIRTIGAGVSCLEILLNRKYDVTEHHSGMQYYSSFICVPQTVARQCSMVQFGFSQ